MTVEYVCMNCGKIVTEIDKIVCPYCNMRILAKKRINSVRELEAK